MKKICIIACFVVLGLGFLGIWQYPKVRQKLKKQRLVSKLNVAKVKEEGVQNLSFVIVIPSYNNEKYCEKNLESVFSQNYPHYRVIYIDDASTDATLEKVSSYVESKKLRGKVTLIHNLENQGALANIYKAVHSCRNDEIVILCDGDDWLASDQVLTRLNEYYNNKAVWMTYGQYLEYPSFIRGDRVGNCAPVNQYALKQAKLRKMPWLTSHLRTFYAGLFKKISKNDLQKDGEFYPTTYDLAIMLPMLEMAREHAFYTEEVFYIYNYATPINDGKVHRQKQMFFEKYIRSLPVYPRLVSHPSYL